MTKKNIAMAVLVVAVVGMFAWAYRATKKHAPVEANYTIKDYKEEQTKKQNAFCAEYPHLCDDSEATKLFEQWCTELPEACARCKADPKSVSCVKG